MVINAIAALVVLASAFSVYWLDKNYSAQTSHTFFIYFCLPMIVFLCVIGLIFAKCPRYATPVFQYTKRGEGRLPLLWFFPWSRKFCVECSHDLTEPKPKHDLAKTRFINGKKK